MFELFTILWDLWDWNIFLFLTFSLFTVITARFVVTAKNPIYSILFLILTFTGAVGILLLLGAEFLAMVLLIVYMGAIAVLFLFVVMMLNIRILDIQENYTRFFPVFISLILLAELLYLLVDFPGDEAPILNSTLIELQINEEVNNSLVADWISYINSVTNIEILGELVYTYYFYLFLVSSLILLVAMLGSIVLTLHHRSYVKRQEIFDQVNREVSDAIKLKA